LPHEWLQPQAARRREKSPDAALAPVRSRASHAPADVPRFIEVRVAFRADEARQPHTSRLSQHDQEVIAAGADRGPAAGTVLDALERRDPPRVPIGERLEIGRRREQPEVRSETR